MEFLRENFSVLKYNDAVTFLECFFRNDPVYKDFVANLTNWFECFDDYEKIIRVIQMNVEDVCRKLTIHAAEESFNANLKLSLDCFVFNKFHDGLMSVLYVKYQKEDEYLFCKLKELEECNLTANELGASASYSIPFHAAVVELSSLDAHKSPLEKINCLCTTHDMVYAQLKSDLAELKAKKLADGDNPIPVIECNDVLLLLITVITKSKLIHFYSNFIYIENYNWNIKDKNRQIETINLFGSAIEKISEIGKNSLISVTEKSYKELSLKEIVKITSDPKIQEDRRDSLLKFHLERVKELISISLTENCD